jgi:hypothetical protein
MLQKQYSITSESGLCSAGSGLMSEITRGSKIMSPFLKVGAKRFVLFPEAGKDIAFRVDNFAFVDQLGRETITWTRTFHFDQERRFDEYMVYNDRLKRLVIYAGSHQHLAVDLDCWVDERGDLWFRTGAQRLYEGPISLRIPLILSGVALVREAYNDEQGAFEIDVQVNNRLFGHIFGYKGVFTLTQTDCPQVPPAALPKRVEKRE